jgi:DNA-binding Lrp family transcriptional regulator
MDNVEKSRVDAKDRRIVECLIRDPQASVQLIADDTGFPPSTVQKHLARLLEKDQLGRGIYVRDWAATGYPVKTRIDIEVSMAALAIGEGGPPERSRTVEDRPNPAPQLPPVPARRMYTQEDLAKYIKEELSRQYQSSIIVESVSVLMGGGGADLSVILYSANHGDVRDFVLNGLRVLRGVTKTTTASEVFSC